MLPQNPSYQLACQLIDNDDVTPWQQAIEFIAKQNSIDINRIDKVSGWANGLFIINQQYVFKIVPPNWVTQAKREIAALTIIKGQNLPVATPQLKNHGDINGWHYMVMNKLEGTNLHQLWSQLSLENRCLLAQQVANFANQLHEIELPTISPDSELYLDWPLHLQKQRDNCLDKYKDRDIDANLYATMQQFIDSVDYQCHHNQLQLLHTDLHPGNMLVQQDSQGFWQLTGVIDFGDALISPERDYEFATSALLMGLGEPAINHALIESYGFDIKDRTQFQAKITVLCILRHIGGVDYHIKRVKKAEKLTDWSEISKVFMAL